MCLLDCFVQLVLESCTLQDTFWLLDMSLHFFRSYNLIPKILKDANGVCQKFQQECKEIHYLYLK